MSDELRSDARAGLEEHPGARLTGVLRQLDAAASSWYRKPVSTELRKRPGPAPRPLAPEKAKAIERMATSNPWYGYQRIAVMRRRAGQAASDREFYRVMKERGLLQRRRPREPALHQAAKLFELLPC